MARRSIRFFKAEPIPNELIKLIIDAGRYAASAVNLQSWTFITFDKQQWQEAIGTPIPWGAPLAILICADVHRLNTILPEFKVPPLFGALMSSINASIAATQMTLAAEALGLGCVMNSETGRSGLFHPAYLKNKLKLPDRVLPLMTLSIGHPKFPRFGVPPRLPPEVVRGDGAYPKLDRAKTQEWIEIMRLGFKIANPFSSFEKRLAYYSNGFDRVEAELRQMIFGK